MWSDKNFSFMTNLRKFRYLPGLVIAGFFLTGSGDILKYERQRVMDWLKENLKK